jgi:hypothetical protein
VPVPVLWYRDLRVGRLTDVFTSDDTWYATIELSTVDGVVAAYIAFCIDWNERQRGSDPPGLRSSTRTRKSSAEAGTSPAATEPGLSKTHRCSSPATR